MNVERALNALGIDVVSQRGDELTALCPMHEQRTGKADHSPSWNINAETGQHICFSCGYKGGLTGLVADVKGFTMSWGAAQGPDYDAAKDWLKDAAQLTDDDLLKALERAKAAQVQPEEVLLMSEARLAVYTEPPAWAMEDRGIKAEACKAYGVLWDKSKEAWITPIRDPETFKLWGWQEKGERSKWFRNQPPGIKKSWSVFGIDAVQECEHIIVVESPLDCLRLESVGIKGGVATFGALPSTEQVKVLRAFPRVTVAMDNPNLDTAGLKASEMFLDFGRRYGMEMDFFNYTDTDEKDIGGMSAREIRIGLGNAKHMVFGRKAFA